MIYNIKIFIRLAIVVLMSVTTLSTIAAQVKAKVGVNKDQYLIGDHIHLKLSANCDKEVEWKGFIVPDFNQIEGLEVLDEKAPVRSEYEDGYLMEQQITLFAADSGYYKMPALEITYLYQGQDKNQMVPGPAFEVSLLNVTDETAPIQDIKPIIKENNNFLDYLPFIGGVVALLLLIWGLNRWLKTRKSEGERELPVPDIVLPPHVIANNKLEALNEKQLWQNGKIKEYQTELTFIFREYLENRFHIPALESTTYEIIRDLKQVDIQDGQLIELKKILEIADLVKFAKSEPPIEIHQEAMDRIEAFVKNTQKEVEDQND